MKTVLFCSRGFSLRAESVWPNCAGADVRAIFTCMYEQDVADAEAFLEWRAQVRARTRQREQLLVLPLDANQRCVAGGREVEEHGARYVDGQPLAFTRVQPARG